MVGIYKITSPSGRVNIGQSVNIAGRWVQYRNLHCEDQPKLYRSLTKYGVDNHIFEVIEECEVGDLNRRERYWQEVFNTIEEGLNCKLQGADGKSGRLSKEVCDNIRKSKKGRKQPNISKAKKGVPIGPQSAEVRKAKSLRLVNVPQNKVTCPHCNKVGGYTSMGRWHFNNCKNKI